MSSTWISRGVGSLARIAAEANGDTPQGTNDAIQQLNQQLESMREERERERQDYEAQQQAYEAKLKESGEKLDKAVKHLRETVTSNKNLSAKLKELEEKQAEAATGTNAQTSSDSTSTDAKHGEPLLNRVHDLEAELKAEREQNSTLIQSLRDQLSELSTSTDAKDKEASLRAHSLEAELRAEREQSSTLIQGLKDQLSELTKSSTTLQEQLERQQKSDSNEDTSVQLETTKDELERAKGEIAQLKELNAKLVDKSKEGQSSSLVHDQASSSELEKELADAKSTIANLEARLANGSEHVSEISALKANQKELQDTIASVREELTLANTKHNEAQAELFNSKEINATLTDKEASLNASITELGSQLSALKLAEAEGIRKLTEYFEQEKNALLASREHLLLEIQELKDKHEQERSQPAQSAEEIKELKERYEQERSLLLAAQSSLQQELDSLKTQYNEDRLGSEALLKERDSVIQGLEDAVASKEQSLNTLRQDLQTVTNDRNNLQSQHQTLVERVKSGIASKLQERENSFRQQVDQLTAHNNSYLQTIDQLKEELVASHEHYEKTSRELEHLRRRLVDIQEEAAGEVVEKENIIHDLQSRLHREEREREDWETMAGEQRASKDQAIMAMRAMERERDAARVERESLRQELDRQIQIHQNLETVMEEFQSSQESTIQFEVENLQRKLSATKASLDEFQGRALSAEERLGQMTLDVERVRQLEREVMEKNVLIGTLRHEAVIQREQLAQAVRRQRDESNQNNVDIPLISNLFLSFLAIPRGDQRRFEILQLIAGVLKFTDEQREQAGLIRRAGGSGSGGASLGVMTPTTNGSRSPSMEQMRPHPEPREVREGIFDMWASFLIRESNVNAASSSNNNNNNNNNPGSRNPPQ